MYTTKQVFHRDRVPCDRLIHHRVQIQWIRRVTYLFHRHWPLPRYTR